MRKGCDSNERIPRAAVVEAFRYRLRGHADAPMSVLVVETSGLTQAVPGESEADTKTPTNLWHSPAEVARHNCALSPSSD